MGGWVSGVGGRSRSGPTTTNTGPAGVAAVVPLVWMCSQSGPMQTQKVTSTAGPAGVAAVVPLVCSVPSLLIGQQ